MDVDYKKLLSAIQEEQLKTIVSAAAFKSKSGTETLGTKRRGLYWLWTSWTNEQLETVIHDTTKVRHVPIAKLVNSRKGLQCICKQTHNKYRLVYNGIGGYRTATKAFGLRERILQEITCNDGRTGTLNISHSCEDLDDWAVSFFDFDTPANKKILSVLNSKQTYIDHATVLENLWRLEYGTPILCRH
jgi:hypothetical protein